MDITFINNIIVTYNELISESDENSVAVAAVQNKNGTIVLLGVDGPNQLGATIVMDGAALFSFSDTNPRNMAERLNKAIDDFNHITDSVNGANIDFDDETVAHIGMAFSRTMDTLKKSER